MQLSFDLFSGLPNPSWRLSLPVARTAFEIIADSDLMRSLRVPFPARLGYRGMQLHLPAELSMKYRLPQIVRLSVDGFDQRPVLNELAAISLATSFFGFGVFKDVIGKILDLLSPTPSPPKPPSKVPPGGGKAPCSFEMLPFDPNPWNDPAFVLTNNCYAYATNKRAAYSNKPQPGIGSGAIYTDPPTCSSVGFAAKRDGAHDVSDCFPDSEAPRMLVALVIWPGEDYHWYRKHPTCWGHKPGSTLARNVDNAGKVIVDPQTCDRGPYTEFCGYMLIPKSQKVAA